ncbi:uncharacterized protein TrAFT101_003540 [Trichoderma asperellum]|uniref:uncharacterized protein n=1 Tax=Trichoderma asperellum TaxID=101201 RepID=UPI00332A3A20|nr:hypothetical protein TrAFT101_003540 [Trichoderma asperellum]
MRPSAAARQASRRIDVPCNALLHPRRQRSPASTPTMYGETGPGLPKLGWPGCPKQPSGLAWRP